MTDGRPLTRLPGMVGGALDNLGRAKQEWQRETVDPVLERFPERREAFETVSGIPLERAYTPSDVDLDYLDDLGFPGRFPFSRGIYPTMYRGRL